MRTSEIISPGARPMLPIGGAYYRQQPKAVLAAQLRANPDAVLQTPLDGADTTQYEFPGDRTYARDLASRAGA